MKISIFGLGYVGTVCGACFARFGHEVIGVDRNRAKVDFINKGLSPVIEDGLQRLVSEARRKKRFYATYDCLLYTSDAADE